LIEIADMKSKNIKIKVILQIVFVTFLSFNSPILRADVSSIQRLTAEGNFLDALKLTNEELQKNGNNVTYRFLKGLILTRMDKLEQARDVFIEITESNPDLPEPYNNLAVIYASMGDFDKARNLLEQAINTHPTYATAHENIGDIYAKLASQAYNQALELDKENNAARAKLSLVNDLFHIRKQ
jgi:tetratricopeptide (TPR) repeat protein